MKNNNKNNTLSDRAFSTLGIVDKLREIFGLPRPLKCVQIEVTTFCSGQCFYCPHTTRQSVWQSAHMADDVFASLWPVLKKSDRAHLQGWGEPFLNPRFFDFAAFARKAGCEVSTTTCGLLMDDNLAHKIIESGMDAIAFSLAGSDAESNNARKNVDFYKVCENIRFLRNAIKKAGKGPAIHLAYILLADRIDAMAGLPDLMSDLEVDGAVVSTLDYISIPDHGKLSFTDADSETMAKARLALEQAAAKVEINGGLLYYALPFEKNKIIKGGCRENVTATFYVDVKGNISPCVYRNAQGDNSGRLIYGNAQEEDPWSIWRKKEYGQFRHNLETGSPDVFCGKCPKRREV